MDIKNTTHAVVIIVRIKSKMHVREKPGSQFGVTAVTVEFSSNFVVNFKANQQ